MVPSDYAELVPPTLTLLALLAVYSIAFGMFRRTGRGTEQRSLVRIRSVRGNNAAMILAVLTIAEASFEIGDDAPQWGLPLLVAAMFVAVGLLAALPKIAEPVFAVAGLASFCAVVFARHGAVIGLYYISVAVAMIVLLAVLRAVIPRPSD